MSNVQYNNIPSTGGWGLHTFSTQGEAQPHSRVSAETKDDALQSYQTDNVSFIKINKINTYRTAADHQSRQMWLWQKNRLKPSCWAAGFCFNNSLFEQDFWDQFCILTCDIKSSMCSAVTAHLSPSSGWIETAAVKSYSTIQPQHLPHMAVLHFLHTLFRFKFSKHCNCIWKIDIWHKELSLLCNQHIIYFHISKKCRDQ